MIEPNDDVAPAPDTRPRRSKARDLERELAEAQEKLAGAQQALSGCGQRIAAVTAGIEDADLGELGRTQDALRQRVMAASATVDGLTSRQIRARNEALQAAWWDDWHTAEGELAELIPKVQLAVTLAVSLSQSPRWEHSQAQRPFVEVTHMTPEDLQALLAALIRCFQWHPTIGYKTTDPVAPRTVPSMYVAGEWVPNPRPPAGWRPS